MRRALAFALLLPILTPASAALADPPAFSPPPAERLEDKGPKLQINVDLSKVDLAGHKLEVTLNRPADKVRIKVIGQSKATLAEVEKTFGGAAAGTVLAMSWTPSSDEEVLGIEVYGYDTDTHWIGVMVTTWHAQIDHEEVVFDSDSDVIKPSEAPKLEASLKKIKEVVGKNPISGTPTLYLIGHTDTVGTPEHNLTLSRARARAIAGWFAAHGLKLPIKYEGVGKNGLLVKTADQVDELKNRRCEYFLGLVPPSFPQGGGAFSWQSP